MSLVKILQLCITRHWFKVHYMIINWVNHGAIIFFLRDPLTILIGFGNIFIKVNQNCRHMVIIDKPTTHSQNALFTFNLPCTESEKLNAT